MGSYDEDEKVLFWKDIWLAEILCGNTQRVDKGCSEIFDSFITEKYELTHQFIILWMHASVFL